MLPVVDERRRPRKFGSRREVTRLLRAHRGTAQ